MITCLVNGRRYIGITSRGINRRWNEHLYDARVRSNKGMPISRAIAKHGAENFRIEAVCCAKSWNDLCAVERLLIDQWETRKPGGYNASDGGRGPFGVKRSSESIERSASKHRGKPCHPNTRAAAVLAHKGKTKSAETRARMSQSRKGVRQSDEVKAKLRAYWAARRANGDFKTATAYEHHARWPAR